MNSVSLFYFAIYKCRISECIEIEVLLLLVSKAELSTEKILATFDCMIEINTKDF